MSTYVRPKLTEIEARALLTIGQAVMTDETVTERVFSNGVDTSAGFRALSKLLDAVAREPAEKTEKRSKKKAKR